MRSLSSGVARQRRRMLGLLLFWLVASLIAWNVLMLISQMVNRVNCHANTTWALQIMELLQQPKVCAVDGPPLTEVLAHCEIAMDLHSQEIRMRRNLPLLTPWLAPIVWEGTFDTRLLNSQFPSDMRIGLTIFAVKKYVMFLQLFLHSAEKYFMVGRKVHYYIFTDQPDKVPATSLAPGRFVDILQISAHSTWQEISMRRMEALSNMAKQRFYGEVQYLVCMDVDMVFGDSVGVEILGELVATLHPGYFRLPRSRFPYEQRPKSKAYVSPSEGDFYYMGAFFAGTVVQIYKLTDTCHRAIMEDKSQGIEAVWHEESHLNRYLIRHKPTKVLSPEYMWDMNLPHGDLLEKKRFIAVPKNHDWIRH
ncbi:histo-blood group ABO system transferase 2-like [Lissotriton helveticus]